MRILVVEDEELVAQRVLRIVKQALGDRISRISHMATLDDAEEFLLESDIDLLFLDINLNGSDGFDLLKLAVSCAFQTVVVSAYKEYAVQAFEFGVLDFIPKPFTLERLEISIKRYDCRENFSPVTRSLTVRSNKMLRVVDLDEVEFIKAADNYSELHLTSGEVLLHDKALGNIKNILPDVFQRVHRSYICRLDRITGFRSEPGPAYFAVLECGFSVPVSRTEYKNLKQQFN